MKPGRSFVTTVVLPSRRRNPRVRRAPIRGVRGRLPPRPASSAAPGCSNGCRRRVRAAASRHAIPVTESVEVLVWNSVLGGHDVVELAEELLLDREVLEHRLDHQSASASSLRLGGARRFSEARGGHRPRRACPTTRSVEEVTHRPETALELLLIDVVENCRSARPSHDGCDAGPHGSCAEYGDWLTGLFIEYSSLPSERL